MEAGFFSGFLNWLLAVVHHWELLVVTGAIPFALYLADTLLKWKLLSRWYFVLVAIGLFLATFAAWREEHEKAKAKEAYMKIEIPQPIAPVFSVNKSTGWNLGVHNIGNFEAYRSYVMRNLIIHDSAIDPQNPRQNLTAKRIEDDAFEEVKRNEPKEFPTESVDPGDKSFMTAWTTHPLLDTEVRQLATGGDIAYMIGFVNWTDGAGTHERTFCYWLHPLVDEHFVWDKCLSHNDYFERAQDF